MRRDRIDLRVRIDEKQRWADFADKNGLKLSEFIRRACNNVIKLSEKQPQKR